MLLLVLVSGCTADVAGDPTADGAAPVTTTTERTTERTIERTTTAEDTTTTTVEEPEPTLPPPPTSVDLDAPQQYCDRRIIGALGKEMVVVVVETPAGRVNCDQASAVLVDYYAERPDPDPGSDPVEVAGFACDQVPEPDQPQVICADGASLFYSMWVQGG